jgi:protein-S-isoprenylcysteine O-methyltransferase Ste14
MIAWLNFVVLIISSGLFFVYYLKSVRPAALEKRIGPSAYRKCAQYRLVSSVFMLVAFINYVVYFFYPLPLGLPINFPWPWWLSVVITAVIGIPCGYLMWRGMKDAGPETMTPKKEHKMYGGIYAKIRHPQAVGEMPLWWAVGFLLHSPFLVLFSFLYIPVWVIMCWTEERDLLMRFGSAYEEYRKRTGFMFPKRRRTSDTR